MSLRAHAAVLGLMLAVSAVMMSPFTSLGSVGSALHSGDGRVQAWVLAWVAHALGSGQPLFDANMFYPARQSLAHTEHMVALGALGAPVWWVTGNAILNFNLLQLAGPAFGAYAMFLLAHRWTHDPAAALVAGLAYGFSSFTLLHNAHLNLTWNFGLPLVVLALERWWRAPTWGALARWWIPAVFTVLVSWYLAMLLVLLMAVVMLWLLAGSLYRRRDVQVHAAQLIAATALAIAVVLPVVTPYLGRGAEAGEAAALSADWRSYLLPSEHTVVGRVLVRNAIAAPQGIWGERAVFLGWTLLGLALFGLTVAPRALGVLLGTVAVIAAGLSFGPSASGLSPFDLVASLPGLSAFRATARFALLVTFACAVLAALAVASLRVRFVAVRQIVPMVAAVLILAEVFVVDFPPGRPESQPVPEIYRLARADGARAAVALPMYAGRPQWFLEGDYLLYSTTAAFLPLANGIGRWIPPEYLAMGAATEAFPSAATAAALRLYGVTHVIFHGARYGRSAPAILERTRHSADFAIVWSDGSDTLIRVWGR